MGTAKSPQVTTEVTRRRVAAITLAALLGLSTACAHSGESASGLNFFLATRDANAYQKEPRRFERAAQPSERGGDLYIEKSAALSVPLAGIRHTTVEKKPAVVDIQTIIRDPLGQSSRAPREGDDPQQYRYTVTFELDDQAAEAFKSFAAAHEAQLVEIRVGKRRLAVVRLMGPFMSAQFTAPLVETDQARIKELLGELEW